MENKTNHLVLGSAITVKIKEDLGSVHLGFYNWPYKTTIITMQRGAITIPFADSPNGLAKIVCHGDSGNSGTHWFRYPSNPALDVTELLDVQGMRIVTSQFMD